MTAIPNKVTRVTILEARVSKAGKKVNPDLVVATWGIRVSKATQAVAASKVSKEVHQIAEVSKIRKEEFLREAAVHQ